MRILKIATRLAVALTAVMLFGFANSARAHVHLDAPNGGEILQPGDVFTITWQIEIAHALQHWHLWYSTTGPGGPWIVIALNLPPGSSATGSIHTYNWTLPNTPSKQVRVRVQMDNTLADYEDLSDRNFELEPSVPVEQSTWGSIKALYTN